MKILPAAKTNYHRFADLVFWRENGQERESVKGVIPADLENPNLWVYAAEEEERFVG